MKSYEFKLYDRKGKYKKTINPKNITSDVSFSEDLNGWQGNMTLGIVDEVNNFMCTDIIEIREVDEENREISPTFTGIIESVNITEFEDTYEMSIELLWVGTALTDIFFKSPYMRFQKSGFVNDIAREIINYFNSQYWAMVGDTKNLPWNTLLRYTDESIRSGRYVQLEFDGINCLESLNKLVENSEEYFFIDQTGLVTLKSKGKTHKHTLGREVQKITRNYTKRELKNYIYHTRKDDTTIQRSDTGSIALFGLKEERISDSMVFNQDMQEQKIKEIFAKKAYESNELEVYMKPQKTLSIQPWDRLTILNVRTPIIDKQVTHIDKSKDMWKINLWSFIYFWM